ncbi:zinc finger protein 383-like [Linepithema humile]|uniref:zinc finger protein 383-like n=1 Tax=Linepithema humile TaxID=83485 RepID=UPI0006237C61|nr:PREDICTED: zinc finger protein 37-like [Linepithema humile]
MSSMQTVASEIIGPEQQPQEEIQLTELQPVKQSRIRENSLKDADATDALRALRSFSGECNDDESFELHREQFDFRKGGAEQSERQGGKRRRAETRRRRTAESRNSVEDSDEEKNDDEAARKKRARGGKNNVCAKAQPKKKLTRSSRKKSDGESNHGTNGKSTKKDGESKEKRVSDYEEDSDEYLDLDKTDCFKDEIYVYRRETPLDPSLNSESEEPGATNREMQRDPCEKKHATTDGDLFDEAFQKKTYAENICTDEKQKKCASSVDDGIAEKEDAAKEFGQKIDAIIQANYQRENNNVVGLQISEESSAAASMNAESSDAVDSSDSGGETKKTKKARRKKPEQQAKEAANKQKKHRCVVCEKRFTGRGGLRDHYKVVHGVGPVFICDQCGKEFALKERLKLHMRTHTGFKPYKCSECDKSFARGSQLHQHRRRHSQIKPYTCELCSRNFTCAANLSVHLKRHSGQKDYLCDLCGRGFLRRDALKKHLQCLHRDVKSFLCVVCNKTFKGHLSQHMRTHARDRPYGCATCGQRFAQKSQLTVHQRTHTGQRPFRCLVCWQAFAHSTALKLHTRRHTGERPFKCYECNTGFTQLPHWKKHMRCIHGRDDPYGCRYCESFFKMKSDLETHEKTYHPTEVEAEENGDDVKLINGSDIIIEKKSVTAKYKLMTVEKMRLLLAVLLKKISKQERLDELGFGKRLIDDVLKDSLASAGKTPITKKGLSELEALTQNLEIFLEWTVPKEHWENFRKKEKSPGDILEALTAE